MTREERIERYRKTLIKRCKSMRHTVEDRVSLSDADLDELVRKTLERAFRHFDFNDDSVEAQRSAWLTITLTHRFRDLCRQRIAARRALLTPRLERVQLEEV